MRSLLIAAAAVLLVGCSGDEAQRTDTATGPTRTGDAATRDAGDRAPTAAQQSPVALGLTRQQLEDADILDAAGREIADVEQAMIDASGNATGLLVKIEDTNPDRYVTIPLAGLTVVQDGRDHDLRSGLTRDQLMAMPEATR